MEMQKTLDELKTRSQGEAGAGDYIGADGLLYCGRCHTPRQMRLEFMGKADNVGVLCRCRQEKKEREEQARREWRQKEAREQLRKEGITNKRHRESRFDNDRFPTSRPSRIARRYVEQWETMFRQGRGLLLMGKPGTGKTFYACCIANALIDLGFASFVTNVAEITRTGGKDVERDAYIEKIRRCDLLVIDDIGAERATEYATESLYRVIDIRYREEKPLIVTTNLTAAALQADNVDKARIYDRITEMCPYQVIFEGDGLRRDKSLEL